MSVFKLWIFSGSFFASDQSLPSPYTVLETLKQFTLNICCTAGVSARSKSPQEGAWVDFKHEAAGQRQEHGATVAQEKHLYRTAGHSSLPAAFWTQQEPRAAALWGGVIQLIWERLVWSGSCIPQQLGVPSSATHFSEATAYLAAGTYTVFSIYRLTVTSEQQRYKTCRNKVKPLISHSVSGRYDLHLSYNRS